MHAQRSRRRGFTLVELLVVITIMGMLMAMIFPAFEQVRESVNRTRCENNIRGLARVMLTIESQRKGFPGLVERSRAPGPDNKPMRVTWAVSMLQALDQRPLYDTWFEVVAKGGMRFQVAHLPTFTCPSDPPQGSPIQPLSYVVNAGALKDGASDPAKITTYGGGVFFNRYDYAMRPNVLFPKNVTQSDCKNGANFTLMMSENIQAFQWADNRVSASDPMPYDAGRNNAIDAQRFTGFVRDGYKINQGSASERFDTHDKVPDGDFKWARPSSRHAEGAYVAFCSGTAQFMAESVEPYIFERLMCSNITDLIAKNKGTKVVSSEAAGYTPSDGHF